MRARKESPQKKHRKRYRVSGHHIEQLRWKRAWKKPLWDSAVKEKRTRQKAKFSAEGRTEKGPRKRCRKTPVRSRTKKASVKERTENPAVKERTGKALSKEHTETVLAKERTETFVARKHAEKIPTKGRSE